MALTWSAKVMKTLAVWPNPKMVVMIIGFGVRNLFRVWFGVRNSFHAWRPEFIPPDTE